MCYVIVDEKVDEVGVLVVPRPLQGGVARHVPEVGAGAVLQQQPDDLDVKMLGRHHDGLDVPQGGVGTFLHQQFSNLSACLYILPQSFFSFKWGNKKYIKYE